MQQQEKGLIESPCVGKCKIKNKHCVGCGRSLEHIKNWLSYSHEQRKKIIEALNGTTGE